MANKRAPLSEAHAAESYTHGLLLMKDQELMVELGFWYDQALRDKDPFTGDSQTRKCFERLSALPLDKPFYQHDRRAAIELCLRLRRLTVFPLHIPNGSQKVVREQLREEISTYLPYALVRELYIRVGTCYMEPHEVSKIYLLWRRASQKRMHFDFTTATERADAEKIYLDITERPYEVRQDIIKAFIGSTTGAPWAVSFT